MLYAVKVNDDPRVLSILHQAGVRHFDCASLPEIERVGSVCPGSTCYFMIPVWLRSAAARAYQEFGALPQDTPGLLSSVAESGAEPALAFSVGSAVTDPQAYGYAMDQARQILEQLPLQHPPARYRRGLPRDLSGFRGAAIG